MSAAPNVKGWCPGALKPMMSGDGLIVRIRPHLGRLNAAQIQSLCDLSEEFGTGSIDLTSRANLQIRGVAEKDHQSLLDALLVAGLLDSSPEEEKRRNILVTPGWTDGDTTTQLHNTIVRNLYRLPALPAKMGIAVDTGAAPVLTQSSADFRIERGEGDKLLLRADGSDTGCVIAGNQVVDALVEMAKWFVDTGGVQAGRMKRHLKDHTLPDVFRGTTPVAGVTGWSPGQHGAFAIYGAPFGSIDSTKLKKIAAKSPF